ncbi:hypothetical protein BKA80DRAFT_44908 [Phyllosticta citrichinensis]
MQQRGRRRRRCEASHDDRQTKRTNATIGRKARAPQLYATRIPMPPPCVCSSSSSSGNSRRYDYMSTAAGRRLELNQTRNQTRRVSPPSLPSRAAMLSSTSSSLLRIPYHKSTPLAPFSSFPPCRIRPFLIQSPSDGAIIQPRTHSFRSF